jgi:hypothetical protein
MKVMGKPLEEETSSGVLTSGIDGHDILGDVVGGEVFHWGNVGHGKISFTLLASQYD